jgi:hypothetical protein
MAVQLAETAWSRPGAASLPAEAMPECRGPTWRRRRGLARPIVQGLLAGASLALAGFIGSGLASRPAVVPIGVAAGGDELVATPVLAAVIAGLRGEVDRLGGEIARLGQENRALGDELARALAERDELRRELLEAQARAAAVPPVPKPVVVEAAAPPAPPSPVPVAVPPTAAAPVPPPDDMRTGVLAYRAGNYARAFVLWQRLAAQGVARAQFHLAALYLEGRIGPVDRVAAHGWATRAQGGGHGPARELLARIEREATPAERAAFERPPAGRRPPA